MPVFPEKANNPIAANQGYTLVSRAQEPVFWKAWEKGMRPCWITIKCHLLSGLLLAIAASPLWVLLVPEAPAFGTGHS